jgi:hypothetical protein
MPIHPDIKAYHAAQAAEDRRICDTLATLIDRHLADMPGAACKVWHRHPVWFLDGNPIVGYSKLKGGGGCIRLLFWSGQSFDEPGLAAEGSFKAAEIRYTARDEIDAEDLARWLAKAVEIQWDYKNIVKRKGKLVRLKDIGAATPASAPAKAEPRLLSGGNPQIAKGIGEGPVRAYIDAAPGWKREVCRRVDEAVTRALPGVRKAVKWNSPMYGAPGRDDWFLGVHCFAKYVKVAFFCGSSLTPMPPGASKQKDVRYLDIREHDWGKAFSEAQLEAWIRGAAKMPGEMM